MLISCGPLFIPLLQKSRGMRQLARLASAPRGLACQKAGRRLAAQSWAGARILSWDHNTSSHLPGGTCRHQHSIPQSRLPSHAQVSLLLKFCGVCSIFLTGCDCRCRDDRKFGRISSCPGVNSYFKSIFDKSVQRGWSDIVIIDKGGVADGTSR